jgi:multifunctional 2-oxoglutarate metabolism enzyme
MSESRPHDLGINSWLEDELYQQYLNDRRNVDDSWKKVFESNGSTHPGNGTTTAHAIASPSTEAPSPAKRWSPCAAPRPESPRI